jgi:hypothetical protein
MSLWEDPEGWIPLLRTGVDRNLFGAILLLINRRSRKLDVQSDRGLVVMVNSRLVQTTLPRP